MRQRLHLTLSLAFAASLLLSLRPVACFACPDPACDTPISVSVSPNPVCVGQTVTITTSDQDKNDTGQPVQDNVNITWDGGSAPPTSFSAAGTYNYTARTDNVGAPNLCNETGVHNITITVVTVDSISGPNYVCINEDAVFTATTNPAGNESMISWSGGGTPATGSGSSFTTKWTTAGKNTVRASCGSSATCYKEKQIDVQAQCQPLCQPSASPECNWAESNGSLGACKWGSTSFGPTPYEWFACTDSACTTWHVMFTKWIHTVVLIYDMHGLGDADDASTCEAATSVKRWIDGIYNGTGVPCDVSHVSSSCIRVHELVHLQQRCQYVQEEVGEALTSIQGLYRSTSEYCSEGAAEEAFAFQVNFFMNEAENDIRRRLQEDYLSNEAAAYLASWNCLRPILTDICSRVSGSCSACD